MTTLDLLHGIIAALIAGTTTAIIIVALPFLGRPSREDCEAFAEGAVQGLTVAVLTMGVLP